MPVSEQTFLRVALEDPDGHWELECGRLRQKPAMTSAHNRTYTYLGIALGVQLERSQFEVRINGGHVRRSASRYYIPDVIVIPAGLVRFFDANPDLLESYREPLPLVVEVWSRSTGDYDVSEKLRQYQERGDLEIWLTHPYERTVRAHQRQPDGSYIEVLYTGGVVEPIALPGVRIDLDALFG